MSHTVIGGAFVGWLFGAAHDRPAAARGHGPPPAARDASQALEAVPAMGTDADLVARIREGDREAFQSIYRTQYAPLLDFAIRIVRTQDAAHDVVQEVFVSLWLRRAVWKPRGPIAAYLYGAVRNRALHVIEHQQVVTRAAGRGEPVAMGDAPQRPDAVLEHDALLHNTLGRALNALPERQRSAVILHFGRGLSVAAVARVLGVSHTAATKLVARAVGRLREAVSPETLDR